MHQVLKVLKLQLENVRTQLNSSIPNDEPFGIAHNNWSFPGLTRAELIEEADSVIGLIEAQGGDDVGEHEARLQDYARRIQHLQQHTIPQIWGNAAVGVSTYFLTLNGLRKALAPVLSDAGQANVVASLKRVASQVRGMEAHLNALKPRAASLDEMVDRIENAYSAADQIPTDLESLSEARQEIAEIVKNAARNQDDLMRIRREAGILDSELRKSAEQATAVLERCETAYSAATSVGLAAAFSERSNALSMSMWFWIGGLVSALAAGSYFGSRQLQALSGLFRDPNIPTSVILLNLMLSVLSVGAPVWFAWLSTKQIGQRFRLAEDYAFKASISRAYEGFRREAVRFDKDMEAKLLTSALTRLDELPLRLVETHSHGSPWQELASSDAVKQALKVAPGFADQVRELANNALASISLAKMQSKSNSQLMQNQDEVRGAG